MEYIEIINKLGGIKPLYSEGEKLTLSEINKLQSNYEKDFPPDYKDFILKNPVCTFKNYMTGFDAINEKPEYTHPPEYNYPVFTFGSSSISVFFSKGVNGHYDLNWYINCYKDRIPPNMLPIFDDGMGNLGLLSLQSDTYEKIYFWDHELEWDIDDYFEETGEKMPEEAKFQNLWLIGHNFTDFLSRCYIILDE